MEYVVSTNRITSSLETLHMRFPKTVEKRLVYAMQQVVETSSPTAVELKRYISICVIVMYVLCRNANPIIGNMSAL